MLLGLWDELNGGGFDLRSLAAQLFSEEQAMRVGKWLFIAGVIMTVLRLVTKGPVKWSRSNVDDPEQVEES